MNNSQTNQTSSTAPNKTGPIKVAYLHELSKGHWIVRDAADLRGGKFKDLAAATNFVRHDFGNNARIVIEARPTKSKPKQARLKPRLAPRHVQPISFAPRQSQEPQSAY